MRAWKILKVVQKLTAASVLMDRSAEYMRSFVLFFRRRRFVKKRKEAGENVDPVSRLLPPSVLEFQVETPLSCSCSSSKTRSRFQAFNRADKK